jgi:hypothetical protein
LATKKKRKAATRTRAPWVPPPPPPTATSVAERDALQKLAEVLVPRVLSEIDARLSRVMAYDHIVVRDYLDDLGYTLTADAEYQEVEPLLRAIALQAVRALKSHYATGPDVDDDEHSG